MAGSRSPPALTRQPRCFYSLTLTAQPPLASTEGKLCGLLLTHADLTIKLPIRAVTFSVTVGEITFFLPVLSGIIVTR